MPSLENVNLPPSGDLNNSEPSKKSFEVRRSYFLVVDPSEVGIGEKDHGRIVGLEMTTALLVQVNFGPLHKFIENLDRPVRTEFIKYD